MKILVVLAAFLVFASTVNSTALNSDEVLRQRAERIKANINDYLDALVDKLRAFAISNGLDPMDIPDVLEGFSIKVLLVTFHGELELTNGALRGISTLSRAGDATIEYENKIMRISADIGFDILKFHYDFLAQIMDIGPVGIASGSATDVVLHFDLLANLEDLSVVLEKLDITHTGSLKVTIDSHNLLDVIANAISRIVTTVFKNVIMNAVVVRVKTVVDNALANINIGNYLV